MGDQSGIAAAASILVNSATAAITSARHAAAKKAQMATKSQMEKDDDALYELWDGVAGDNFRLASYVCEQSLLSLSKRNGSAAEALAETGANFEYLDEELTKNIEITEEDG